MTESSSSENAASVVRREQMTRAFTLVELLAVLAIVALVAALVLGGGRRATELGQIAKTKAQLAAVSAALEAYKRQHGDYPRTGNAAELLQALIGRRGANGEPTEARGLIDLAQFSTDGEADPFVETRAKLVDAWGAAYVYAYKTGAATAWKMTGFVLYSAGPDREHVAAHPGTGYIDAAAAENADNLYAHAP
ncbi:MAG TPA: type II secretion system protein GspG [Opitutus sp.]|nr:type II secretion system protein GspG [Opitutus sp.]